jgi:dienelactone hydrolase
MKRILVLLLVLTLAGCSSAPSTMKVDLTTSDAVNLKATYYSPKNSTVRADALLLLHEAYDDSRSWDSFGRAAQERGYAVLALDLRGHGQSGGEKTFDSTMDNDVDAALAWLKASPAVNSDRIGIVGASLGANLALRGGAHYPEIKSVILLSPGMLLWQIDIAKAIVDYGSRPLLLVASKEDAYPAGTVQTLNEQALGYHQLQIYPGAEHGTKMMAPHPDLVPLMLDWLQKTIQ